MEICPFTRINKKLNSAFQGTQKEQPFKIKHYSFYREEKVGDKGGMINLLSRCIAISYCNWYIGCDQCWLSFFQM